MKYLDINPTKYVQELNEENCKTLMNKIKEGLNKWNNVLCSWIGRLNIVKMLVLPNLTYRFDAKAWPLCTSAESNLRDRVLGEVEKNGFVALPGKGGQGGLLPSKTMCPNLGGFDEEIYSNSSRVGLLTRLGCEQGVQVVSLLILMSFSGPFNLASGGFLSAPPLTSNFSNLPFGTQGRSWRLEPCLQETGDKKASMPRSPTGSFLVLDLRQSKQNPSKLF